MLLPDDAPVADLARIPAAAHPRARLRDAYNRWTNVPRARCGDVAGQLKVDESPGNRDPMTWFMRVKLEPSQGPMFKRRSARIVGETDDFAKDWIETNRKCC